MTRHVEQPGRTTQPAHPGLAAGPIYLDYNATTPIDPRVTTAALPYLSEYFGNPSSGHAYGRQPRAGLARARGQVAALIGADAGQIIFTGSGSEADTLAIRGAVLAALGGTPSRWDAGPPHVITQVSEHPAVLGACEALHRLHGVQITYLPVDHDGLVHPGDLAAALTERTVLVTIMHANNETGVIQPIANLAALAHTAGALFHTDAAQSVAKIPLDVTALGVDLLTLVGHKMYAPKGIAALYLRDTIQLEPLVPGGGQERGLRAGTENVALAVALGAAADLAQTDLADGEPERLRTLREALRSALEAALPGRVHLNGHPDHRLPHTLNISIDRTSGDALLAATLGLAASTGSACHTGTTQPSPVLQAMGITSDRTLGTLRLSLGRWTTTEDVDRAARLITQFARHGAQVLPASQPSCESSGCGPDR